MICHIISYGIYVILMSVPNNRYLIFVMNHVQKKQQGFDLFDFIFKNQTDSIYCASNNTNFEDVKVFVEKPLFYNL